MPTGLTWTPPPCRLSLLCCCTVTPAALHLALWEAVPGGWMRASWMRVRPACLPACRHADFAKWVVCFSQHALFSIGLCSSIVVVPGRGLPQEDAFPRLMNLPSIRAMFGTLGIEHCPFHW